MSKIKLNKKFREKWLAALRSGKYKQGRYHLICPSEILASGHPEYCCLGVAAKVCGIPDKALIGLEMPEDLDAQDKLPRAMKPLVATDDGENLVTILMDQNDVKQRSFKQIAAFIEKRTVGV